MERIPLAETLDFKLYLADDGAGEFEVWLEDFAVLGTAPTRRVAIRDAIGVCARLIEALSKAEAGCR